MNRQQVEEYIRLALRYSRDSHRELDHPIIQQSDLAQTKRFMDSWRHAPHKTLFSLCKEIEAKDPCTRGHSERVTQYAELLADSLGLDLAERKKIILAGYFHDIGKIAVDQDILNKAGQLDEAEFRQVQVHAEVGFLLLATFKHLGEVAKVVRHHHERWQGNGYPDGLSGSEIPLAARILALADAYDAMTSNRSYRQAMPPSKAIQELQKQAGSQFDPSLTQVFIEKILIPRNARIREDIDRGRLQAEPFAL